MSDEPLELGEADKFVNPYAEIDRLRRRNKLLERVRAVAISINGCWDAGFPFTYDDFRALDLALKACDSEKAE